MAPSISTDEATSNPTPATQSHPHDRSLKTDTVNGRDMLNEVVGKIASTGDSMAGISAAVSDYVGPPQRRVGQTSAGDAEDGFEDSEDSTSSDANTGPQRKCPREDGSTSRDVPCIDEFAGITKEMEFAGISKEMDKLLFILQGMRDTMEEKAKARERALREVIDPWDVLKEIPGIDYPTRFKALRILCGDKSVCKSFIRMNPEERKNWIDLNL